MWYNKLYSFQRHLRALAIKEFRQILRDISTLLIGIVLPIALILIFGYGMSMDVKQSPIAIVMEDSSPASREVLDGLNGSEYFIPKYVATIHNALELMRLRKVDAIIRIQSDFAENLNKGNAQIQLILHGTDSSSALIIKGYVENAITSWAISKAERVGQRVNLGIAIEQRMWFNVANTSTWYLVPGLIAIIMTIVGAFLTSLVMAREWERGTLESLFVTPVRPIEILIAKVMPPFCIGLIGLTLCVLASRFLFEVPMHGSLLLLVGCTMIYLLVALGIGLLISSMTRNQFLACQFTILISFMPAVMLSGFLFDLRSVPAIVQFVGKLLPATYYIDILKNLFLSGNNLPTIAKDTAIMLGYAILLIGLSVKFSPKKLD